MDKTTVCLSPDDFGPHHDTWSWRYRVYTTGSLTHTRSSDGGPNPDGVLKNTVRTKIIKYRRLYVEQKTWILLIWRLVVSGDLVSDWSQGYKSSTPERSILSLGYASLFYSISNNTVTTKRQTMSLHQETFLFFLPLFQMPPLSTSWPWLGIYLFSHPSRTSTV